MSTQPGLSLSSDELLEYVVAQRWSGANDREAVGLTVLDQGLLRPEQPVLVDVLVEVRYGPGTHDVFQILLGDGTPVGALADPAMARRLVELMRTGATLATLEGTIEFSASGSLLDEELSTADAHVIGVEQSNSSVVLGDRVIVKAYRRLDPGVNPELEMLQFLGSHGFENVPELAGWWTYTGTPTTATLGTAQEFASGATDGWSLALDELREAPDVFLDRLERLGQVIGGLHLVLASDSDDPAFAPEEAGPEALSLLAATMDDEIDQVFTGLPDNESVEPIAGCGDALRDLARSLAQVGSTGRMIRQHGDLHLGQLLWADGDWLVVDFEGEPARSLHERRRKRSPLRDVAGMLRSFAYAARVAELGDDTLEERARSLFLDAYLGAVQGSGILPSSVETTARLLEIFEL